MRCIVALFFLVISSPLLAVEKYIEAGMVFTYTPSLESHRYGSYTGKNPAYSYGASETFGCNVAWGASFPDDMVEKCGFFY